VASSGLLLSSATNHPTPTGSPGVRERDMTDDDSPAITLLIVSRLMMVLFIARFSYLIVKEKARMNLNIANRAKAIASKGGGKITTVKHS
jgi:hypothetical protein